MTAAIVARNVTKTYGPTRACDGIDLVVREGSVHALLGENGAGKSTFVKILYGLTTPDAGTVEVWGRPVTFRSPADALADGIGMVQQHFSLAPNLTAEENLALSGPLLRRVDRTATRRSAEAFEESTGLSVTFGVPVGELGVGEQQRLEILRALLTGARLLILDEPTAVLSNTEASNLLAGVRRLAAAGTTVMIITHRMDDVFAGCDHVTVLRHGRVTADAPTASLTHDDLVHAITGDRITPYRRRTLPEPAYGDVAALRMTDLRVDGWAGAVAVDGVSLDVAAGEIVGIAGVEGNGQRQLCEALTGLRPAAGGSVSLAGTDIDGWSPRRRLRAGLAYISEDRHHEGLMLALTAQQNYAPAVLDDDGVRSAGVMLRWGRISELYRTVAERFDIRPSSPTATVGTMSGGNQQKIAVGRATAHTPVVVVASQPSRGVDLRAAEDIRAALVDAAFDGAAVIVISADLEELLAVSHRIVVMARGALAWSGPADPDRRHEILAAMTGGRADELVPATGEPS